YTTERHLTHPEIPAGISVNCNPNSPPWSVRGASEVRFSTLAAESESRHWHLPKKDMTPSASTFPAAPSSELDAQHPVAVRTSNLASPTSRNRQGTKTTSIPSSTGWSFIACPSRCATVTLNRAHGRCGLAGDSLPWSSLP